MCVYLTSMKLNITLIKINVTSIRREDGGKYI